MALLPSEICRLILGFLEEEKLFKTYDTFLCECKYLDECRIYSEKGIKFQKSVHGKNLIQHLNQNYLKSFASVATHTSFDQTAEKNYSEPIGMRNESDQTSISRRKSLKRKNTLLSPVKSVKPNVDSVIEDFDETLLDIDSFIKNLCENDFPERLAQSINDLNTKKNVLELSDHSATNSPEVQTMEKIVEKNLLIKSQSENNNDNENEQDKKKILIANEEISILAEHFSEPVVDTLFDVFNSSQHWYECAENGVLIEEENRDKIEETLGTDLTMNLALDKSKFGFDNDDGEILNGLEFLAKAASNAQNESLDEKMSVTSTPSKKQHDSLAKRSKTIREIYDEEHKVNEENVVVNSLNKIEKKNVNKSAKRSNRTYFYDFYQDIKNDVEENEKELPST